MDRGHLHWDRRGSAELFLLLEKSLFDRRPLSDRWFRTMAVSQIIEKRDELRGRDRAKKRDGDRQT